jgi:hypothetical protein
MPLNSWKMLAGDYNGEFSSLVEMFNVFGTDTLKVLDRIEKAMVSSISGNMQSKLRLRTCLWSFKRHE